MLACAFAGSDGICINDSLAVPTDAETLVSLKPDASTLCWFWPATQAPGSLPGVPIVKGR